MNEEQLHKYLDELRSFFSELDKTTTNFLASTQIHCKPGCGACCMTPRQVWATVGEMLGLAWKLYQTDAYQWILDTPDEQLLDQNCVVFKSRDLEKKLGSCGSYETRPSVCRLFGAAYRKSKNDAAGVLACAWQKEHIANASQPIDRLITANILTAQDWSWRLRSIFADQELQKEFPINLALKQSLKIIDQAFYWQKQESSTCYSTDRASSTIESNPA